MSLSYYQQDSGKLLFLVEEEDSHEVRESGLGVLRRTFMCRRSHLSSVLNIQSELRPEARATGSAFSNYFLWPKPSVQNGMLFSRIYATYFGIAKDSGGSAFVPKSSLSTGDSVYTGQLATATAQSRKYSFSFTWTEYTQTTTFAVLRREKIPVDKAPDDLLPERFEELNPRNFSLSGGDDSEGLVVLGQVNLKPFFPALRSVQTSLSRENFGLIDEVTLVAKTELVSPFFPNRFFFK